jgi:hypothetical protein
MAYTKTNWTSTTPISTSNLNKIEDGISANDTANTNNATNITDINNKVGTLSNLNTTDKSDLVSAINEVLSNDTTKGTYSTNEIVIGKWIDGKPIYRKTFSFNLGSSIDTWSTIATIDNIKLPIKFYGMCWNVSTTFNIPRAYSNEDITLYCDTASKLFREQHNYSYANGLPAFAVIEYTKTTD